MRKTPDPYPDLLLYLSVTDVEHRFKIRRDVNLHVDGVAHLPIPEVLGDKTPGNLSWLLIKLHDDAVNASKEPEIKINI
jgi:hypothetical protein